MNPHYSIVSILLAFCIGIVAAWSLAPGMRDNRALDQIVDENPDVRQRGWTRLLEQQLAGEHLHDINDRLRTAADAAVLDGSEHLRRAKLWDWGTQPTDLILREARLRSEGNAADKEIAAQLMASCPLELDEHAVMPIFWRILHNSQGRLLEAGKEAAFGWVGPHRFHSLRRLPILEDEDTRRMVRLAVYWAQGRAARPLARRSWAHLDAVAAKLHLDRSVVDANDMVYAAALLAEHSLPRKEAVELAGKWVVDLENDRKRAGALLAALLGEHADLLREALDVATDPHVRTTQRLALLALGRPIGNGDDIEFAYRALHLPDGHVNPDTLFCLLVAGHADAPRYLASTPLKATGDAIRARTLLIERFIPYWNIHEAVEDGPTDPVQAYYEAMRAVWMLTHRWIDFDVETRTWHERPAPQGDAVELGQ